MTTLAWILFWTLIWPVGALLINRLFNPPTPERRVAALLAWYPAGWRERPWRAARGAAARRHR